MVLSFPVSSSAMQRCLHKIPSMYSVSVMSRSSSLSPISSFSLHVCTSLSSPSCLKCACTPTSCFSGLAGVPMLYSMAIAFSCSSMTFSFSCSSFSCCSLMARSSKSNISGVTGVLLMSPFLCCSGVRCGVFVHLPVVTPGPSSSATDLDEG